MRDLPLRAEHERLGARLGDVAGWTVPLDYGDEGAEQRAVHEAAGLIDWTPRGKIRVTGEDRLEFLDNLVTNDVMALAEGRGLYAVTLDHKGRVRGDMAVYRAEDHYLLETDPAARASVLDHFRKLLVSEDVTLEDVTDDFVLLGLFGPGAVPIAEDLFGAVPEGEYDHRQADWRGEIVRVARSPYFGGDGLCVWAPPGPVAVSLHRSLADGGAVPVGARAADTLRIEAGRPRYGVDMGEDTLAVEARLESAISRTKGCYVGQEVVSRATHVGRVNRLLVGLRVEGDPPGARTPLFAGGKEVGFVTSAATSATLGGTVALGYARREFAAPGTVLETAGRTARVAELPFAP